MINNLCNVDKGVDFGLVCWHLWKQRNKECMDMKGYSEVSLSCKIEAWFRILKNAQQNVARCLNSGTCMRMAIDLAWEPPLEGCVQIQKNGYVLSPSWEASGGGLIRDNLGRCLAAFVCNLGKCSITAAELKGAVEGLKAV
ncbi:unnamed protein product [Linum trigynum]|uniref:RNase H type-1 domain-containing protein n=1 Tax=Linum trigynum TaxID=586398 RepID=A0AAV2FLA2_9ROSI